MTTARACMLHVSSKQQKLFHPTMMASPSSSGHPNTLAGLLPFMSSSLMGHWRNTQQPHLLMMDMFHGLGWYFCNFFIQINEK